MSGDQIDNKTVKDSVDLFSALYNNLSDDRGVYFVNSSEETNYISYTELYSKAKCQLAFLTSKGLKANDELIFQINENSKFLITFWACILGKIKAVPINPANTPETRKKLINVWNTLDSPYIIATDKIHQNLHSKLNEDELRNFSANKLILFDDGFEQYELCNDIPVIGENDTAFIQFSSGSTGNPKGVVLSHKNLLTNCKAIIHNSLLTENDSTLGWMPLTHDLGLIGFHLVPLVAGVNQYLIPTELFVRRPTLWIEKINEYRISFTASPNFGYKHFLTFFKQETVENWDLSCVRRILNGAEPISAKLCDEFLACLACYGLSCTSMFPVYGMAEASLAVAFPNPDQLYETITIDRGHLSVGDEVQINQHGITFVCVGKAVQDCRFRISNYENLPLGEGKIGTIEIKGGNVTSGYFNNKEANKQTFTSDGWLRTGDLGFVFEEKLYITGREKDIIFSNGLNFYPHDLERIIEEEVGIDTGKIVVCGVPNTDKHRDEIIACVYFKGKIEEFLPFIVDIKSKISKRVSLDIDAVFPVKSIEKTTSGKVKRFFYVENYKKGIYDDTLDEINQLLVAKNNEKKILLPTNEIEQKLIDLWGEILQQKSLSIDDNFFEVGGNSLLANMLIGRIAKTFNAELSLREVFKFSNVIEMAKLLSDKKEHHFTAIPKISKRNHYPVSSAQKRIFILNQLEPESLNYNISAIYKIGGVPDAERINNAFNRIVERHSNLRTYFDIVGDEPVQKILDTLDFRIQEIEFKETIEQTSRNFFRPFNLFEPFLFRIGLACDGEGCCYLLFDIHHIISDGYSLNLIIKEFSALYTHSDFQLTASEIDYIDFSVWQQDYLQTDRIKKMETFWMQEFQDEIPVLNFPTDFSRDKNNSSEGGCVTFELDTNLYEQLYNLAEKEASTYYILFLTTLNVLLSKYTHQEDVVIGSPVTSRSHADLEHVFGPFINSVAIRNKPLASKSFKEFHEEVKDKVLNVFSNQDYPFEQLVDALHLDRDLSRNALFDILFVLQNANKDKVQLGDLEVQSVDYFNGAIKFDLNIHAWETDKAFRFKIEYSKKLFKHERIERFAHHFKRLLTYILNNFDQPLSTANLLNTEEKETLLDTFNRNQQTFSHTTAISLFEKWTINRTHEKAVVFEDQTLTFQQLDECANFYAQVLRDSGISKGDFVGISLETSVKVMIAIVAIWKVGAIYVPIDPENPIERKHYILQDSNIQFVFAEVELPNRKNCSIGYTNTLKEFDFVDVCAEDGAYVIYTSGTTGQPKGTVIPHGALANYVQSIAQKHAISSSDSSILLTSYAFDLGYTAIFGAILNGGCIHFVSESNRKEADFVLDYIVRNEISFIKSTPSQLFTFTTAYNFNELSKAKFLKKIFTGGEAVKIEDLRKFSEVNSGITFINHYGPTESTIGCITHEFNLLDEVNASSVIGSPIHNTSIYVLDTHLQPVPVGVDGELYVSGAGLAQTYVNQVELYKQKFTSNPFVQNTKMYATGDIGRWTSEGTIQFLGRKDDQVKIRGYRVELKGIESHIKLLKGVTDAVVVVSKDNENNNTLCAYVVVGNARVIEFRNELFKQIPDYMIPSFFIEIDEIPITANGKLDKKRLPKPEFQSTKEKIAPINAMQEKLAEIWEDVLGINTAIGINENFFEIGGHSLKATITISKIHQKLNVRVTLREFFENPEIQLLDKLISTKQSNPYASIPLAPYFDSYPVSAAQKRMFILNEIEGDATSYNMPGAFWIHGKLDVNRLKTTFELLIKKHESLRTSFGMKSEELKQYIHHSFQFEVEHFSPDYELEELIKQFVQPFDLRKAPLFRVGLVSYTENKHVLLFDIHHIISDGSSMGIIIKDFVEMYEKGYSEKLKIQYKDFAVWQESFFNSEFVLNQKKYWTKQLEGNVPLTELPTDFERPRQQTFKGESFTFQFDEQLTTQIKHICKEQDITVFMLIMGIYQVFLAKQTGQDEFTVGTPVAGRPHVDLQDIIGVFLNTLVIKATPKSDKKVSDFLQEIKRISIDAFENQDYPFHELVENLSVERIPNRNPLFDTMLVVQNMNLSELKTSELVFEQHEFDLGSSQVDISWIVFENEDSFDFTVNFNTALFKKTTIERFIERFKQVAINVCQHTELPISAIEILPEKEKNRLLMDFNSTDVDYNRNLTIIDLLTSQAQLTPDTTAVIDDNRSLTYEELNRKTNQLANLLIKEGVEQGAIVPLVLDRSIDTVISIIGVLKTGATYVFIDPDYPDERKMFMLEDCQPEILITHYSEVDKIDFKGRKICIDEINLTSENPNLPILSIDKENTAYLIFTSGSTGKPKGVMISHRNVLAFVNWALEEFKETSADIIYNATSYSFDLSIFELFYTLSSGKTLRVIKDGLHIANYLQRDKNILINTVPIVVKQLLDTGVDLRNVVAINMAGEPIPQIVKQKLPYQTIEIRNLYGPSEDTTYSTLFKFEKENHIQNIGKPLSNTKIYIVDENLELSPIGSHGELCISGEHLAKGYLNRPLLTEERFIENPFDKRYKLYRTGDLARWLDNGEIEYLGRIDNQVKIRGFRIELEEIEKNLFKHAEIKDAVVVDLTIENTGDKFLCAYYVSDAEIKNLASFLAVSLPAYMIPSHFVRLEKLPISPNGKTDKKALPYPDLHVSEEDVVLPNTEIEAYLVEAWKTVLGVNTISIHTNFFSIGGDSIKAIQVAAKLQQVGLKLEVRQLFDYPTISELAPHVLNKKNSASQEEFKGFYPLNPIQELFFEQKFQNPNHWNQAVILELKQNVDMELLQNSFYTLIAHHDVLRTQFVQGQPNVQSVQNTQIEINTIASTSTEELFIHAEKIQGSLSIENGKLINACVFDVDGKHHLLIVIHHLVVDGVSWRILLEDLQTLLSGASLPLKTNGFHEWTNQLQELAKDEHFIQKELPYWQNVDDQVKCIPFSEQNTISESKKERIILDEELTQALVSEANVAFNTEVNDLLLTALNRVCYSSFSDETISVMLEGHGRENSSEDLDITRTIGWFTSMFPVNLEYKGDLREHIIHTKDSLHKIPKKGFGYGVLKFIAKQSLNAKPSISFNYLGELDNNSENGLVTFSTLETGNTIAQENNRLFLLDFNLMIKNSQLMIELTYNHRHLSGDEARQLLSSYHDSLKNVIDFCLGKEQAEVTLSDMSFEMNADDFDNIF
jgi:amino acid adenylation domain-containing protein/non-ribosomal peptide synthase protein (TIGR01720 family)